MANQEMTQLDARIAHYRFLRREVTDSLAACLLNSVIVDLESERKNWHDGMLAIGVQPTDAPSAISKYGSQIDAIDDRHD